MAQSPDKNAATSDIIRYDLGWNAINALLRSGRSLSGHERNCCFLNTGGSRFANVSAATGLDFIDDGRVLSLADWDYDGDVDFWIANRSGPQVRYVRNNLDSKHHFVAIRLRGVHCNRNAIGARVLVVDDSGRKQYRTLRAGDGYLSQSSKWLHFGLGDARRIDRLVVLWPGVKRQTFENVTVDQFYDVTQGDSTLSVWKQPTTFDPLDASDLAAPPMSDKARIVLLRPVPLPRWNARDREGNTFQLTGVGIETQAQAPSCSARLINLWASWCQPCLKELSTWKQNADRLKEAGLEVVTINVDQDNDASTGPNRQAVTLLDELQLPFRNGWATDTLAGQFDVIQRSLLSRQRPLPVPSSFLVDTEGRLRVVYKGPVSVDTLIADAKLMTASPDRVLSSAMPFEGRWLMPPTGSTPLHLALKLVDGSYTDEAQQYINDLLTMSDRHPEYISASLLNLLGAISLDKQQYRAAAEMFHESLKLDPENRTAHIELGGILLGFNKGAAATPHFETALRTNPDDPELWYNLGLARLKAGDLSGAEKHMRRSLDLRLDPLAHWQLGAIYLGFGDARRSIAEYESALEIEPKLVRSANDLAWLLATLDDDQLRNGKRAILLAEEFCRLADPPSASQLDTLAAAYAEMGQFAKASEMAENAVRTARALNDEQLATRIDVRRKLYLRGEAFRSSLN